MIVPIATSTAGALEIGSAKFEVTPGGGGSAGVRDGIDAGIDVDAMISITLTVNPAVLESRAIQR